ncbi:MAG: protein-ADP-ribose hydrolase [Ruminococcus sp.]|nr:protein-ADP-ribose hydrolase [Ruminococcus sp.]
MTHEEQRIWLIRELQKEPSQLSRYTIPADEQGQKDLLRGLMNIWMPKPISEEYLRIESEYLKAESEARGITKISDLTPVEKDLYLWQGDITTLECDAVTNAANSQLLGCFRILHNCIDNCLHSAAGISLRYRCYEIMRAQGHEEPTGQAKITPAYNLPSKYVIHTVGPIVSGRLNERHCELLKSCYRSCLKLAEENGCKSLAFCCISTGVFGFPQKEAAEIAVHTVRAYKKETGSEIKVIFNVFKDEDLMIYRGLFHEE